MALNIPAAVTTLTTIAKTWADAIRDSLLWLATDAPTCRVYNSANISITTSGTAQALTFDSERFDVGGCHSTSVNTGRITVPSGAGGKWQIGGSVEFASNSTGYRQVYIRLNGTTAIGNVAVSANATAATQLNVTALWALSAGDYVELVVVQTSGGALNVTTNSAWSPEFWAEWRRT